MKDRATLTTERRNAKTCNIDRLSTLEMVRLINSEDKLIAPAVAKESKHIAEAIDVIVERMKKGGRLFYVGAGTSGRLGVLDASECPPTFGTNPSLVQGIIAGGRKALVRSIEGAEDRPEDGADEIDKKHITQDDIVVGIAACGLTPYVRGALKRARTLKAATIFILFHDIWHVDGRNHFKRDINGLFSWNSGFQSQVSQELMGQHMVN